MLTIVPIGRITATDESRVVDSSLIDNRVQTGIRLRRPPRPGRGTTPSSERGTSPRAKGNGFPPSPADAGCNPALPIVPVRHSREGLARYEIREWKLLPSIPRTHAAERGRGIHLRCFPATLPERGTSPPRYGEWGTARPGGRRLQSCATDRAGPSFPRRARSIRDTGVEVASVISEKARHRAGPWDSSSLLPGYSPGAGDKPPRYEELQPPHKGTGIRHRPAGKRTPSPWGEGRGEGKRPRQSRMTPGTQV